ncbi:LysR family transcriptional regulator [Sessilibacter sp. MAH1]
MSLNVTIKQLSAFVALAQSRSFAEACERLHLSQPALSISIKNLEEALGGALFFRSTRSVHLTPEGEAFYPAAQRLLGDWQQTLGDVVNAFNLKQGRLILSTMPSFAVSVLPKVLREFRDRFPNINILLHDVLNESVIDQVREGRSELGVCFNPGKSDDLTFIKLFNDELVGVVSKDHPLASQSRIKLPELLLSPLIVLQAPSSLRLYVEQTLAARGLGFAAAIEVNQLATVGQLVGLGLGVSVVPRLCEQQMIDSGAVCVALDQPILNRDIGIVYRTRFALSSPAIAMRDLLVTLLKINSGESNSL